MPTYLEPLMRCVLAYELKKNGFKVHREQQLIGQETIDIIALKGNTCIGIEVKAAYPSHEGNLRRFYKQIGGYHKSGYLDELYVASSPSSVGDFDKSPRVLPDTGYGSRGPEIIIRGLLRPEYGTYSVDVEPRTSARRIKSSPPLDKKKILNPTETEADVGQIFWEIGYTTTGYMAIPEAFIIDKEEREPNKIDFMILSGSQDVCKIFQKQDDLNFNVTGIEVKNEINDSLEEQLRRYLHSGCLTYLYVCVPKKLEENQKLWAILGKIEEVGLLVLRSKGQNSISEEKKAERLKIEYDSWKCHDKILLVGKEQIVDHALSTFYCDDRDEVNDRLRGMSSIDKREEIGKLETTIYKNKEDAKGAIDKIYAMQGHPPSYRSRYDYNSKGWVIEITHT